MLLKSEEQSFAVSFDKLEEFKSLTSPGCCDGEGKAEGFCRSGVSYDASIES